MLLLLVAVIIVLLSSGLCSGTEAALFSVPVVKVRQLVESNKKGSPALLSIRENMSRPIASIVILNNVANIVGSIVVGGIATDVLGSRWLGLFSGVLTFLVIILSEIIPKTLGEQYAEKISLLTARPVLGLTYLLTPIVWSIEKLIAPLTKGQAMPTTNEAEIKLLANIGRQEGIIEADESEMIQRVFALNDLTAADLMSPRVIMTRLHENLTLDEAREKIISSPHSRIIITGDSVDTIVGVALKDELLAAIIEQKGEYPISTLAHKPQLVPETIQADTLLQVFQQGRQHLAIVVDEFGGVSGVITLEDVLETLTGQIVDETDRVADLRAAAREQVQNEQTDVESP